MHSPAHTGARFNALCGWIGKRFDNITVIIADTLQAHNMGGDREGARKLGDDWLQENQDALNLLPAPIITRWDDWLNGKNFEAAKSQTQALYTADRDFKSTIDSGVDRFLKNRIPGDLRPEWEQASKNLLLEEAAVILMDSRAAVEFYPGTVPALAALGEHTKIKLVRTDAIPVTIQVAA